MNELRNYMNELLAEVPKTRKALELKEELISNMEDRYKDMLADGFKEEDARQSVIESMGDIKALFAEFKEEGKNAGVIYESEEIRRKRAWINTIAVGLYLFGGALAIIVSTLGEMNNFRGADDLAPIVFLVIAIIPTCMLVYSSNMYPKKKNDSQTVVEEFKEWQNESKVVKQRKGAISTIIWLGAVAIYFLVSFETFAWEITWITFLIAGCIHAAVELYFSSKKS